MDIDMVTEKGSGPLRAAHENGRACSSINEALRDPRADVPGGADDEVFHLSMLQPRITSSAIRFWPASVKCRPSPMSRSEGGGFPTGEGVDNRSVDITDDPGDSLQVFVAEPNPEPGQAPMALPAPR